MNRRLAPGVYVMAVRLVKEGRTRMFIGRYLQEHWDLSPKDAEDVTHWARNGGRQTYNAKWRPPPDEYD